MGPKSLPRRKASETRPAELPPAYTPTNRAAIMDNLTGYFAHQPASKGITQIQRVMTYPQASISTDLLEDDNGAPSSISLRISTHVNVSSHGNLIALPHSPSDQAKSIAKAIIEAFHGRDGTTGMAMLDESGLPRPLKLDVDAGMTIEGASNVIGTESIISEVLRQRRHSEGPTKPSSPAPSEPPAATSSASPKRRASEPVHVEMPKKKRARSEA